VQLKDLFSNNAEVVDVICTILRAGFSEGEPGPFVFPPQLITELITGNWQSRIATVVNIASVFVSSLNVGLFKKHIEPTLRALLPWVFNLLHQLPSKSPQPDVIMSVTYQGQIRKSTQS
jgi:hypothetical protein